MHFLKPEYSFLFFMILIKIFNLIFLENLKAKRGMFFLFFIPDIILEKLTPFLIQKPLLIRLWRPISRQPSRAHTGCEGCV